MLNPFSKIRVFYNETIQELQKSYWPNASELRSLTFIALLGVLFMGIFTSLVDFALYNLVNLLTYLVQ